MIEQIAARLYRRLFGTPGGIAAPADADRVLDGIGAIALLEARISDGALFTSDPAGGRAWAAWQQAVSRQPRNLWGRTVAGHRAGDARGAMAAAMGQALAGQRSTLFLTGPELASAQDQLTATAGRHLPLVIHLLSRAMPAQGVAPGSGDRALQLAGDSGAIVLRPESVQQAVDLALVAHHLAETLLRPVVVAMDMAGTALSLQELRLPDAGLVRDYLGASDDLLPAPDTAQGLLFGEHRRRVPRWHDLDRPMLNGTRQDPGAFARGSAGNRPWFGTDPREPLRQACRDLADRSGRPLPLIARHRVDDAELLLLAHGSVVEQLRPLADALRRDHRIKTGVIGLRTLHPLPEARLLELLKGRRHLVVLERHDTPLAGDPPLLQRLRGLLAMAADNRRREQDPPHPRLPALDPRSAPRLHSALYGVGGLELAHGDLLTYCRGLEQRRDDPCWLGVAFHADANRHPKRQVLLDQIRRAWPGIEALGLHDPRTALDLRSDGAFALGLLHRPPHQAGGLPAECASLVRELAGGHLRGQPDLAWERWDDWRLERLLYHPEHPLPPAGESSVDLLLVAGDGPLPAHLPDRVADGGGLLLCEAGEPATALSGGNSGVIEKIREKGLRLFHLPSLEGPPGAPWDLDPAPLLDAYRLGGLFAALVTLDRLRLPPARVLGAWKRRLEALPEGHATALATAFEQGMARLGAAGLPPTGARAGEQWREQVPGVVRQLGAVDAPLASLPRFWDQVGILYRDGEQDGLTADPYLTAGTVPPLSSTFRDMGPLRPALPRLLPERCSGCGDCWSACPDSAIGVTALSPAALVDCAIRRSGADAARQVAGKLAARISALGRQQAFQGATAGELLERAWHWLSGKAPLPEGRRETVEAAVQALIEAVGPLPLARTDLLFEAGERQRKDAGELLALVVNPDACKGCGLCLAACPEEALEAVPRNTGDPAAERRLWQIWEQTPDTPSATIERLAADGAMNGLAALLLSRHCAMAAAPGDGAEAGSGSRLAVRLALAAAEYRQQPLVSRFAAELERLEQGLTEQIRDTLTSALPVDDLDALLQNLGGGRQIDLATLTRETGSGGTIDARRLERLIQLARDLQRTRRTLTSGEHGLGRARYGLALAPGGPSGWAACFPDNPFHAPVTLDMGGDGADLAWGLLQGQLAEALATLDLARRARHLLDGGDGEPAAATWDGLDPEERALCPPLILLGSEQELGGRELARIAWLLNGPLPLKVLLLSELDLGLAGPTGIVPDAPTDPLLTALAQRSAYVAQCAISEPGHYHRCLREALAFPGPALIRLHAPSPLGHGFAPDRTLEQARRAVAGRALPLLRYHPEASGVFGSRIDLTGNPDPEHPWAGADDDLLTPLHWMLGEGRFRHHFTPLAEEDPAPLPAHRWLALEPGERRRHTPVIHPPGADSPPLRVSAAAVAGMERLGQVWRTLQELAGLVTPFTEQVRQEAERQLAAERAAELAALEAEYEARLQALQEQTRGEISGRIRERLLELAGYK